MLGTTDLVYTTLMKRRPLSLFLVSVALLLVGVLGATAAVLASSDGLLRPGGPVSAGAPADNRGVERILLPAGDYEILDQFGAYATMTVCGPRLLLGVRDGDGWLLSDGVALTHYRADQRISPLAPLPLTRSVKIALYWDPSRSDTVSLDAARASIRVLLPLYASLYTGGALQIVVDERGELTPAETNYTAEGYEMIGPDLGELRSKVSDGEIAAILSPARRNEPLRGYASIALPDTRAAFFSIYTTWFLKADSWKQQTGRALDSSLSFDDLRGRALLETLSKLPTETSEASAIAWHETLHTLEWRALPRSVVHDYDHYGHTGAQDGDSLGAIERSWYGLFSAYLLGGELPALGESAHPCSEPVSGGRCSCNCGGRVSSPRGGAVFGE